MTSNETNPLDPVTFEVLKNSFITAVDQMAEQMLRTCYSFVIYNRDFSNGLHDAEGNSVAQGNQDIAVHVGTLHFTCKDVIRTFEGEMKPGDVYAINDPYAGGTHFSDVRLIRPIFDDDTPPMTTSSMRSQSAAVASGSASKLNTGVRSRS